MAIIDRKLAKRVFGEEDPLGADLLVDHFNEKTFSLERLPVRISASSRTCGRPRSPRRGARRCTSCTSSTRSCP